MLTIKDYKKSFSSSVAFRKALFFLRCVVSNSDTSVTLMFLWRKFRVHLIVFVTV